MSRPTAGDIVGRLVAFLVAGAVVTFTVAVVSEFLGLPPWLMWTLVAGMLALLAWRISGLGQGKAPGADASETAAARPAGATGEEQRMDGSPLVGVVMGSASDQEVMQDCARTLRGPKRGPER